MHALDKSTDTDNSVNKNKVTEIFNTLVSRTKDKLKPTAYRLVSILLRQNKKLEPEFLLGKFRQGQFPIAGRVGRLVWLNPELRAIVPLDGRFHVQRSLEKKIRSKKFDVTFNSAFHDVVMNCAVITTKREWTWLSPQVIKAFVTLHEMGYAHSFESWEDGKLVGGGFGVAIGGYFTGLSMFTHETDASKVGFVHLQKRLCDNGYLLFDAMVLNDHTRRFGAFEMSSPEFKNLLGEALKLNVNFA